MMRSKSEHLQRRWHKYSPSENSSNDNIGINSKYVHHTDKKLDNWVGVLLLSPLLMNHTKDNENPVHADSINKRHKKLEYIINIVLVYIIVQKCADYCSMLILPVK